jgi:hypothetical protein
VQAQSQQKQHGKEQCALVASDHPTQSAPAHRLGRGEDEAMAADVGVEALLIGVRVVAMVLVDPPPERQPDGQVAMHQADQPVGAPGPEDLPMPGVVSEEPALGEHHGEVSGSGQLPPRVAEQHESGPAGGEREQARGDVGRVEDGAPFKQTRLAHQVHEFRVIAAAARLPGSDVHSGQVNAAHSASPTIDDQ